MLSRSLHARSNPRRGVVLVLVILALTVLLGCLAVAVDAGMLLNERRHAQTVADAAALAAAADLYQNYRTNAGLESNPNGTAHTSAFTVASANGYTNDGKASIVTVRVAPQQYNGGPNAGTTLPAGYAEVTVQYNQPRGFSALWGSATLTIGARAVARGQWVAFGNAFLLLDPTDSGALTGNGGGSSGGMTVTGGSVFVDSSSSSGGVINGHYTMTAPAFDFVGNPGGSSPYLQGTIIPSQTAIPDPLNYLTPPNPSTMTVQTQSGNTLNPGVYPNGISLSGQSNVTLNPGIYYLEGGGLSLAGQASLTGSGVMLYIASGSSLSIAGQGNVTLSPPTSGIYQGITIFQDRSSTASMSIKGKGTMNITGTIYAASAAINIAGNGSGNVIGSQVIGYTATLSGNGTFNINYSSSGTARTRLFGLVE